MTPMSMDGDTARRRTLETAEAVILQRALVRRLKSTGQDTTQAEQQLAECEARYRASLNHLHSMSGAL
jgi:hypothetical protein